MDFLKCKMCLGMDKQKSVKREKLLFHKQELLCSSVQTNIFFDRIEYRILFALAKLTESNNEYYSCCEIYSNNIRIVQDIRIFSNNL